MNDPCYEHSPVNNMKTDLADFEYIYDYPEGVCFDAAVLTAAALRVANIPAMVHMEIAGGFHANVLAYINNEWVKIDSTFCTQQQIDSGFCKDASYIKKSAYSVHEIWEPIDDEYCRRDGFCMKAPGIPTSNEILSSSKSLPLVTIIYPRFFQLADAGINIICMGSGWNLGERANNRRSGI